MKQSDVIELVTDRLLPAFDSERRELDRIDRWVRTRQPLPRVSGRSETREHRYLAKISRTPWLRTVVLSAAQMLKAESVYSAERDVEPMWKPWERNLLPRRQNALHAAAIQYGTAYGVGLPGQLQGEPRAVLNLHSPREMIAVYGDPAVDEWPLFGMRRIPQGAEEFHLHVLDEESLYILGGRPGRVEFIEERRHDLGICPIVRYSPRLDLEGRAEGEVGPYIETADRLNKTDYDRMLAQHFNSWKVKTATQLDDDADDDDLARTKMKLAQDDILVGTGDTQFGVLDETSLDPFVKAHDTDLEALAAVSQTRVAAMTGKLVNVSADAINEANASAYSKRDEFQTTLGGAHTQLLRLASHIEGREEDAQDYTVSIGWADTDSRTLAMAVDALGKAATMLGVPPEKLWPLIPGIDVTQAREWETYARENPSADRITAEALATQLAPTVE